LSGWASAGPSLNHSIPTHLAGLGGTQDASCADRDWGNDTHMCGGNQRIRNPTYTVSVVAACLPVPAMKTSFNGLACRRDHRVHRERTVRICTRPFPCRPQCSLCPLWLANFFLGPPSGVEPAWPLYGRGVCPGTQRLPQIWSGWRESNPRIERGMLVPCRWATPASVESALRSLACHLRHKTSLRAR
jgi:hypothetical protein